MKTINKKRLFLTTLMTSAMIATPAFAQDAANSDDQIIVTGTRIVAPGIVSSSPITTVDSSEIELQQTIEIESLIRDLPITIPGDGQNVNNGTAGIATINLRALGTQRTLTMMDGKRLTPFDVDGRIDTQQIPANLIKRIDIVTGGASATYGSDAMAGAVNFIMKDDFEGVTLDTQFGADQDGKARKYSISALLGSNFADDRGNAVMSLNYSKRDPLLLGERELGLFGISTRNGPAAGGVPASPDANCDAPNTTLASTLVGSTTSIPTALDLPGGTLQVQNDRTLAARCSRFNFNPFNYYQTPQEKYNLTAIGSYDINDSIKAYSTMSFTNVKVRQQVAPSGIFGTPIETPLQNPFFSQSARDSIVNQINQYVIDTNTTGAAIAGFTPITFTSSEVGGIDNNMNGVFDDQDSILVPLRRRTLELGTRSTEFDQNSFRLLMGIKGDFLGGDWDYDVSFQHGETDVEDVRAGYTNLTNIRAAVNTVSDTACTTPGGVTTSGCVPIDIFGPFGAITAEAAQYAQAIAILKKRYSQDIFSAVFNGPIEGVKSPWSENPIYSAFGFEYRAEAGETIPDECLKLAPASCQGGAGGNVLPIQSSFDVYEMFGEAVIPVIEGAEFAESISLELGARYSDYNVSGGVGTWKAGVNWQVNDDFRMRGMYQEASRAPNIGELGSPVTSGLSNADFDPCSNGNPDPISAALSDLCVSTGVSLGQVGNVNDIVSNQISIFQGSNLSALPKPEVAETITAGFVWQPSFETALLRPTVSVDYYDIKINDYIGTFSPQEVLDQCYVTGDAAECAKINRINGSLATSGAGVNLFTTNLEFLRTEGVDVSASAGYDMDSWGQLNVSAFAAFLMTQESLSSPVSDVIDCLGLYGNDCSPTPKFNSNIRTTWSKGPYSASVMWRHIGGVDIQEGQKDVTFDDFESINAFNYFDFTGSYDINDTLRLTFGMRNMFDKAPPIVGNSAGTTSFNNGNTFPSTYDILGRTYRIGLKATF